MAERKFPTTQWNLVLSASAGNTAQSQEALATLCRIYWYPLYGFVRRQGYTPDEAQDLTQGFFARLLEKKYLRDYRQEKGRFRSFLLASLKHFLSNERDWRRAEKRGGTFHFVSVDTLSRVSESRFNLEPRYDITPEQIFERQWALALLEHVVSRIGDEFAEADKRPHFERFKTYLTGDDQNIRYHELASELGMSEGAVKVVIHRLRRRFRELLREEISQTVAHPDEVSDEIRHLMNALR